MKKIFIDESGDLGEKGSKYFVITALVIRNEKPLNKIIKNMRRNKFKKQIKKSKELKANNSSNEIREYLLKKINDIDDIKVINIILNKNKIISKFLKNDKNKYYNFIAGKLATNLDINDDFEVIIDKSKGKFILRKDFDNYFETKIQKGKLISICHSYSENYKCIQIVDFIAWACFQKFEYKNSYFSDLLNVEQYFIEMYN